MRQAAEQLMDAAGDGPVAVLWAAGTVGVGSSEEHAQQENQALRDLIEAMGDLWPRTGGRFFLASSAGAVYAGVDEAPYRASSPTRATSPYGRAKLWQEGYVQETLPDSLGVLIGRLGNVYGSSRHGRQGLISRLCMAALTRNSMNLFVPMDTLRDYCFVDDAAHLVWRELLRDGAFQKTSVIASGRSVSVSEVVSTVQQVTHRRVPIALGVNSEADRQPIDLRLIPDWLLTYPEFEPIDLGTGIKRIVDDLVTVPRA
jgi:UDP-glucose 4-epimerase